MIRSDPSRWVPTRQSLDPILLICLAWLVIVAQLLADHWAETATTLSDMDDAMRLVQMRAFLSGRGWFDLHEPRLGPPAGYDTHWSRLIDAGLAGLFLLFNRFADAAFAERLVRAIWPMLWLIPALAGAAGIAWRLAGRPAAAITLVLSAIGLPAFQHFIPGRIDHHNVQIALSILLVAATLWSDRLPWAAAAAGILTGAAMAIGFEGLPYVVLAGAAMALRFVFDRSGPRPLVLYGACAAISVAAAFAISISPAHWRSTACDAIAINSAAAAVIATLGLAAPAAMLTGGAWSIRACSVLAVAAAGGAAFIAIEPQCLGGPFAMMDPMVRSIWFVHVSEMQPLWTVAFHSAPMAAAVAAFPAVAIMCTLALAASPDTRDFGFIVAAIALAVAVAVMCAMVRAYSYAIWLAMPLVATGTLRLFCMFQLRTLIARAAVVVLLTPTATSAMAFATVQAMTHAPLGAADSRLPCLQTESYALLAKLAPGLVVTDIDYGPFVLALTPHSVMSAPYHHLVAPIIAANQIFSLPPEAARMIVAETRPDYLVVCGRHTLGGLDGAERAASLWARLTAGDVPDWLEPVEQSRKEALVIYRVKR